MKSPPVYIPDENNVFKASSFCMPKHYEGAVDLLVPGGVVSDRVERLALEIAADMCQRPLVALCVLKGGYKFFTELLDKVKLYNGLVGELSPDSVPLSIEFIRLKSYKDDVSCEVEIIGPEVLEVIRGKNVLIVEDLMDTGNTMKALMKLLEKYQPKLVKIACLLVKRTPFYKDFKPDYCGFSVPDKFIVGYAIDYNEFFRDLNHICVVNEEGKKKYRSTQQETTES